MRPLTRLFERKRRSDKGTGILKPEFLTTDYTDGTDNIRGRLGAWGRGGGRGVFASRPLGGANSKSEARNPKQILKEQN